MFKTVAEARAARQKALETMEANTAAGGDPFDTAKADFTAADQAVKRLEFVEAEKIKSAQPVDVVPAGSAARVLPQEKEAAGLRAARFVKALAACRGDAGKAAAFAVEQYGEDRGGELAKALTAGSLSGGGATIPQVFAAEIIGLLRAQTVVRRMGARQIPLPNGAATVPRMTGGGTANYIGETQDSPKSEATFGQMKLTAKKLSALTPVSNDLIQYSSVAVDNMILDDLIMSLRLAEDAAFLRGSGTEFTPRGIRNSLNAANVIAANATVNLANITQDLGKIENALMNANVAMVNVGYVLNPTTYNYLKNILNANGVRVFPELDAMTLRGYPVGLTTQVPSNMGGSTNESEVYFVNFIDFVIADVEAYDVKVSSEASYMDGSTLVSAFSRDETVLNIIARHDCGMRYDRAAAVLTGAVWR
jgi:HK97 family phage major capsid protein